MELYRLQGFGIGAATEREARSRELGGHCKVAAEINKPPDLAMGGLFWASSPTGDILTQLSFCCQELFDIGSPEGTRHLPGNSLASQPG